MYDILIRNGSVMDGTASPAYAADVAVSGGKIAAVGRRLGPAREVIDAAGKTVAPGFIDIHRHADAEVFREGFGELELRQGLTTIVNGNCGLSAAPIDGPYRQAVLDYLAPITGPVGEAVPTGSLGEYLRAADHAPLHTGMLAGAGTIRAAIAGYACPTLDQSQLRAIQKALEKAPPRSSSPSSPSSGGRTSPSPSTCGRRGTPYVTPWRRCSPWRGGSISPSTSATSRPWAAGTGGRRSPGPSP